LESFSKLSKYGLRVPSVPSWAEHAWHLFVVQIPIRDKLQEHLAKCGISTLIHYPKPPHLQKAYEKLGFSRGAFPKAEKLSNEVLSLPIYPGLTKTTASQISLKISKIITEGYNFI
jgi:dTDP-4-amino-4,6-dideoxygalactose transaminase